MGPRPVSVINLTRQQCQRLTIVDHKSRYSSTCTATAQTCTAAADCKLIVSPEQHLLYEIAPEMAIIPANLEYHVIANWKTTMRGK